MLAWPRSFRRDESSEESYPAANPSPAPSNNTKELPRPGGPCFEVELCVPRPSRFQKDGSIDLLIQIRIDEWPGGRPSALPF
jgi:hypothetical protein